MSADPPVVPASRRLDFLDALRGVAVGFVLLQHVGEQLFPAVRRLTEGGLQLGQLGVMVFFLCSGFIIPASLERTREDAGRWTALAAFWRGRFFRLYPLYWVSLAAALLLTASGGPTGADRLTAGDWLANTTMVQGLFGRPDALGLYWTLAYEMVFYVALSGLFLLGLHRRSVALSLLASAACVGLALVSGPLLGRPAPLAAFCLATMFTGTVFARWHAGTVRLRTLVLCVVTALAAGCSLLFSALAGQERPELGGSGSFVPMLTAWLGAYAVFCAGVALRRRRVPGALRWLGTISYSAYLVQALVLLAVPPLPHPALTALLWVATTVGVSALTYQFVELPAVRWGRQAGTKPALPSPTLSRRAPQHAPVLVSQRAVLGV